MGEGRYTEIDDRIIGNIQRGRCRFGEICDHMITFGPNMVAWKDRYAFRRLIDRRLQSLRKRGIIKFSTESGWEEVDN
jgi:hypothetical protein